jgi:uncharacterized protein (TIGR02452 family)
MAKPIKSVGKSIKPVGRTSRDDAARMALETVAIAESGTYTAPSGAKVDIKRSMDDAKEGTVLYKSSDIRSLLNRVASLKRHEKCTFAVHNETTFSAAERLVQQFDLTHPTISGPNNVAALNFASAKSPGGGFFGGAQAQEESLARASGLYACLLKQPEYYDDNRRFNSSLYLDHLILSPQVPVFRGDDGVLLEHPYQVTIITSPAPNYGAMEVNEPENLGKVEDVLRRRTEQVLAAAAVHGNTVLVLGAWGCGVFRNDPNMVARLFAEQLKGQFLNVFEHVTFAIVDRGNHPSGNLIGCFEEVFI